MRAPPRQPTRPRLPVGAGALPRRGSGVRLPAAAAGALLCLVAALPAPARAGDGYGSAPGATPLCAPDAWSRPTDAGLCRAAGALAHALAGAPPEGRGAIAVGRQLAFHLEAAGVADAQVRPYRLAGAHLGRLLAELDGLAARSGSAAVVGVGLAPEGEGFLGILLVSRRLLTTEALPRLGATGAAITYRGRLGERCGAVSAWLGTPDGDSRPLAVERRGDAVTTRFVAARPGRYLVEWLVDAGEGPEVATLAPVHVDVSAPDAPAPPPRLVPEASFPAFARGRVSAARRALGRPPVVTGGADLDRVADAAARDSARRGRVTHRPVSGGTLSSRLGRGAVAWAWAGEALGSGPDPTAALEAILASPVHRHTLTDPRAERLSVASVEADGTWWVALVAAAPLGDRPGAPGASARRVTTGTLLARAHTALSEVRRQRGLAAPVRDPRLDDLAADQARRLAMAGRGRDPAGEAGLRRGAFAADPRTLSVRVETVIAGRPEAVVQAPGAAGGSCDRIGLGLARGRIAEGTRLWLTLICVGLEGTR